MQDSPDALQDWLLAAAVPLSVIRNDPSGDSWLPAKWRACIAASAEYREVFEQFIADELELGDSVRLADTRDIWFTARVVEATGGAKVYGAGLDPRYRNWIVTGGYALAIVMCACFALEFLGHMHGP